MTHWAKFAQAEQDLQEMSALNKSSLPSLFGKEKHRAEIYGGHLDAALSILRDGVKFYLPDINILQGRQYDEEVKRLSRPPYDRMCVLSEVEVNPNEKFGSPLHSTWMISCVVSYDAILPKVLDGFRERFGGVGVRNLDHLYGVYSLLLDRTEANYRKWALYPLPCIMSSTVGGQGYDIQLAPDSGSGLREMLVEASSFEYVEREFTEDVTLITNLCTILNTKNSRPVLVPVPPKLAKKREKRGHFPLFDYHILEVGGERWDTPHETTGNGTGFRSHLRRGHIRRLGPDHTVWVRNTIVHGKIAGFVDKDYEVVG